MKKINKPKLSWIIVCPKEKIKTVEWDKECSELEKVWSFG